MQSQITKARISAGLTQTQLAEKIGCTQKDISRWERGERNAKLDKLKLIAEALKCDIIKQKNRRSKAPAVNFM